MDHDCRQADLSQPRLKVEIGEAPPDALLHPANHAERREVAGSLGVCEVAGDAQLEGPVAVRFRIALSQVGRRELRP